MKVSKLSLVALFASAITLTTLVAPTVLRADDISYTVDQTVGPGSVTGFITTDGTIGTLDAGNLVAWNLLLNDGTNTTDVVSGTSSVGDVGNDLTASPTALMFNFSGADYGYFYFNGAPPSSEGQLCYTASPTCFFYTGTGFWGVDGDGHVYTIESGNQIIATATPEPDTSSLMLIGIGFVFVMRKRIGKGLPQAIRMRRPLLDPAHR
jgi:hypothetical protein